MFDLVLASNKLDQIDKVAEELSENMFNKLISNSYFSYIICTILKVILLYLIYKLYKYVRNRCKQSSGNCQQITNCLTLNICKRSAVDNIDIELQDASTSENREATPVRRSLRIAKLKDKI